ncbi:GerMN domain-containing protein [Kitasatospora sp. NPDC094019]|uniref:GerMN domain-containing protein n=1 Tax=Kitasatospora sp. NPDC094019 TaxID=3364091 RepID=UPI0037FF414E
MTLRHRHRRLVVGAASLLLLATGCSIPSTGAVRSGRAATGIQPGTRLYFPGPQGIGLAIRPGPVRQDLQQTLNTLLAGPDDAEARAGFYSALPASATVLATSTPGLVTLRLSWPTASLTTTAVQQLVCTTEDAPAPGPPPRVSIVSSDAPSAVQQQCDLHRAG